MSYLRELRALGGFICLACAVDTVAFAAMVIRAL